jgi:hypothetical protein
MIKFKGNSDRDAQFNVLSTNGEFVCEEMKSNKKFFAFFLDKK